MNEKIITNKIITADDIIELANKFDQYEKQFEVLIKEDNLRNENKMFNEQVYRYRTTEIPRTKYEITFIDGSAKISTNDINIFKNGLERPIRVNSVNIYYNSYYTSRENGLDERHHLYVSFYTMLQDQAKMGVENENADNEFNKLFSKLQEVLERCNTRYDKTIKNRTIVKSLYSLFIGSIVSHVAMFIMFFLYLKNKEEMLKYIFENPAYYILAYLFLAIVLGLFFGLPKISRLYFNIEPQRKYNASNSEMINEFCNTNEICFGIRHDCVQRRNKIAKITHIARIGLLCTIILAAVISVILLVV